MAKNSFSSNRNAVVRTRTDRTGKLRTETTGRDAGALDVSATTDIRNNSTRVFIDFNGRSNYDYSFGNIELTGREARTLYRVLQKHFENQGKPLFV